MSPADTGASPSSEPSHSEGPLPIRRTRKQVSRACDLCRARRIRCDNAQPCRNCRQRGSQCTHQGDDEPRTLPVALREIERLKLQVKELEAEVSTLKLQQSQQTTTMPTPDQSSDSQDLSLHRQQYTPSFSSPSNPRPQWVGIHVATAGSDQASYYGPASSFYLVSRIGGYLGKMLKQPYTDRSLQPRGANTNSHMSNITDRGSGEEPQVEGTEAYAENNKQNGALTRPQEEALLRLFWEGYHCLLPIVDEVGFRRHYHSLWEPSRPSRRQCPLTDIILALCLQYGYTFIPKQITNRGSNRNGTADDATVAGRWYYLRAQSLLTADLESPSITTVQCYMFMICYLCCASFQNMCHIMEAQAVRTAQVLGLHLEPPIELPRGERELRRRIWWALWTLEAKTSTKFGRPLVVDWSQTTVNIPSDDLEIASYNGATLGSHGGVTWLTYAIELQKLYSIMVDISDVLIFKFGELVDAKVLTSIYNDAEAFESCAKTLANKLPAMIDWVEQVPGGLKTARRNGGTPFSADRFALNIEALAPTWLQRQRVCLELTYHGLVLNLTRPFITFQSHPDTYTPNAERHATTCVNHAISFTLIMHQTITETDLLSGWSEYFGLQWNAAITIVGFILAYPIHVITPRARQALEKALVIFDTFGANYSVSADAAAITRDLMSKADLIAERLGGSEAPLESEREEVPPTATAMNNAVSSTDRNNASWMYQNGQNDAGQFNQFMDWAFSVDNSNGFERIFDANKLADLLAFGQPS